MDDIDLTIVPTRLVEWTVDQGIRHRPRTTHRDYLRAFLRVSRPLACASQDDSWGEFEKEFAIIVRRMIEAERAVKTYRALLSQVSS